ncbi:MAG: flagellar basal body-associated FliL family protein [Hydrogenophaga sp.]|nr:flagellar basal body-associated FliL family protein [Hydrogenophaga sp.]
MSAATATDAQAPAKPKSKLMLIIVGVVVLALIGAGAAFFLLKKNAGEDEDDEDYAPAAAQQSSGKPRTPPTFLPMDNMVVNLADQGGNRFVQLGITLQVQDAKTGDELKAYMPTIRSGVLLLISQRTTDEILQIKGKEQLSADIIAEISGVMGYEIDEPEAEGAERKSKRRRAPPNPVQAVLFSSFIVQ